MPLMPMGPPIHREFNDQASFAQATFDDTAEFATVDEDESFEVEPEPQASFDLYVDTQEFPGAEAAGEAPLPVASAEVRDEASAEANLEAASEPNSVTAAEPAQASVSGNTYIGVSSEDAAEVSAEASTETSRSDASGLDLTGLDFSGLEDRVLRAVALVRQEREGRITAQNRVAELESLLLAQTPAAERLQKEVDSLRAEREQVRLRIDHLLAQLDALEL